MEYYSHTINITNFSLKDIDKVEEILKAGYIYSRRNLKDILHINKEELDEKNALFNGMDYVSLCDLSKKHREYSAYEMYVKRGLSFLFNKKIEVIVPSIVNIRVGTYSFISDAHYFGLSRGRYSDLYDEVQVKDKVSLNNLEGMILSLSSIKSYRGEDHLLEYLKLLKKVLILYQKNVPIINLDTEEEIYIEENKIKI